MSGDKPETIVEVEDTIIDEKIVEETTADAGLNAKTIIELLRHGELEGDDIFRGSTDDQLTDNGWQQMVSAIEGKEEWDIIITSPLSSCNEFAEVIAQEDEIDLEINKQFKEIDFGDWEDKTPKQLLKEDADLLAAWWQSPTHITPPNGEDFLDFKARVLKAFKEVLQEYQGKRILLVTHSGVIRVIIMNILGMQDANLFSLNVNDASYSKIVIENDSSDAHGVLVEHH
jgi:alpha-ribazole phosphatase